MVNLTQICMKYMPVYLRRPEAKTVYFRRQAVFRLTSVSYAVWVCFGVWKFLTSLFACYGFARHSMASVVMFGAWRSRSGTRRCSTSLNFANVALSCCTIFIRSACWPPAPNTASSPNISSPTLQRFVQFVCCCCDDCVCLLMLSQYFPVQHWAEQQNIGALGTLWATLVWGKARSFLFRKHFLIPFHSQIGAGGFGQDSLQRERRHESQREAFGKCEHAGLAPRLVWPFLWNTLCKL